MNNPNYDGFILAWAQPHLMPVMEGCYYWGPFDPHWRTHEAKAQPLFEDVYAPKLELLPVSVMWLTPCMGFQKPFPKAEDADLRSQCAAGLHHFSYHGPCMICGEPFPKPPKVTRHDKCESCNGIGADMGVICAPCHGTGYNPKPAAPPKAVECPVCGAVEGERCRSLSSGLPMRTPHPARHGLNLFADMSVEELRSHEAAGRFDGYPAKTVDGWFAKAREREAADPIPPWKTPGQLLHEASDATFNWDELTQEGRARWEERAARQSQKTTKVQCQSCKGTGTCGGNICVPCYGSGEIRKTEAVPPDPPAEKEPGISYICPGCGIPPKGITMLERGSRCHGCKKIIVHNGREYVFLGSMAPGEYELNDARVYAENGPEEGWSVEQLNEARTRGELRHVKPLEMEALYAAAMKREREAADSIAPPPPAKVGHGSPLPCVDRRTGNAFAEHFFWTGATMNCIRCGIPNGIRWAVALGH